MPPLSQNQPFHGPAGKQDFDVAPMASYSNLNFAFHRKNFTVTLARGRMEIHQALRLRYQIFQREFGGKRFPIWIDRDQYDKKADLLVIKDNDIGKVVGTYRLINSHVSRDFYSSSEFNLGNFLTEPSVKVELSRACVHKNYRTGLVVHLLWRGLAEYIRLVDAKFLFGCSSIKTMELNRLRGIYEAFDKFGAIDDTYEISPLPAFKIEGFSDWKQNALDSTTSQANSDQEELPALLRAYLKAGAKVSLEPAIDRKFKCIDFLTILNVESLSQLYAKKYSVS